MAQFDIISVEFPTPSGNDPAELQVNIDNPQSMIVSSVSHDVPNDVEQVPQGQSPTQALWVHEDNYHLSIILQSSTGSNPLAVSDTNYFNEGEGQGKYVDVIVSEKGDDEKVKTRKIRRKATIVFT